MGALALQTEKEEEAIFTTTCYEMVGARAKPLCISIVWIRWLAGYKSSLLKFKFARKTKSMTNPAGFSRSREDEICSLRYRNHNTILNLWCQEYVVLEFAWCEGLDKKCATAKQFPIAVTLPNLPHLWLWHIRCTRRGVAVIRFKIISHDITSTYMYVYFIYTSHLFNQLIGVSEVGCEKNIM